MTDPQDASLSLERRFDASPEAAFDAWLDPEFAARFLFVTPTGPIVRCQIDARAGGGFKVVRRDADGTEVEHVGEYLEIDRPRRLSFSFGVPKFDPRLSVVTLDLVADGTGTRLTLTNTRVLRDWAEKTKQGWGMILDTLGRALAG